MDLNNNINHTEYKFIKKAMMLSGFIANRLDQDQELKRLVYYNTKTPLSKKGISYDKDATPINQPDIDFSIIETNIENGMFDDEMQSSLKNQIFIHVFSGSHGAKAVGTVNVAVNILVDKKFEYLADKMTLRSWLIADRVANLFHNVYIDSDNANEYMIEELGNLQFKIADRNTFAHNRPSNSGNMALFSIVFNVDIVNMRIE